MLRSSRNTTADCSEQFALSWQPQKAFFVSLMCKTYIEGPPRQFDALLAHLHSQSMLFFAKIALDLSNLTLEPFKRLWGSSRCVPSSEHTGVFIGLLRSSIFYHNVINGWFWVSKEPNYLRCWAPSAKAFNDRGSSIIFCTLFWCHSYFEVITIS